MTDIDVCTLFVINCYQWETKRRCLKLKDVVLPNSLKREL